jgi:hypothetical protein
VAKKSLRWAFNERTGQRVPFSIAEDLFGCFDALVLHADGLVAIQWTDAGSVSRRRHKIEAALGLAWAPESLERWLCVEVWGWKPRRPLAVWRWRGGERWERIE